MDNNAYELGRKAGLMAAGARMAEIMAMDTEWLGMMARAAEYHVRDGGREPDEFGYAESTADYLQDLCDEYGFGDWSDHYSNLVDSSGNIRHELIFGQATASFKAFSAFHEDFMKDLKPLDPNSFADEESRRIAGEYAQAFSNYYMAVDDAIKTLKDNDKYFGPQGLDMDTQGIADRLQEIRADGPDGDNGPGGEGKKAFAQLSAAADGSEDSVDRDLGDE